jgi:hypothetical protein
LVQHEECAKYVAKDFTDMMKELTVSKLFDRVISALRKQLDPLLDSLRLALTEIHVVFPIVVNLDDPLRRACYAAGLPSQYGQVRDLAKQAGLNKASLQTGFLCDIHELLQDVAKLRDLVQADMTPDQRRINDNSVSMAKKVQIKCLTVTSAPEMRDLFKRSEDVICNQLDCIADAEALRAEVVRQSRLALQEAVEIWVGDVSKLADVIHFWCPEGWQADAAMFNGDEEAKARRQRLLCNPHYKDVASAVELLSQLTQHLAAINLSGHPVLVNSACLHTLRETVKRGGELVLTTYGVFLICEKLPSISSPELRKAEVANFRKKLKAQHREQLPAEFEAQLSLLGP